MKLILTMVAMMAGLPAFAIGHKLEIDSKVFFAGKKVASPRIVTNSGVKAKVLMSDQKNNREYDLEVLPVTVGGKTVDLQYSLAVRENNNETITRGDVVLDDNKNARILIDRGRIQIHLKIKKS